jgi:hypothetical protein
VPEDGAAVAVKVTGWSTIQWLPVLGDEFSVVVLAAAPTIIVGETDVEASFPE